MGGFIASNEAGITTTLGRGGSDFTGALIGGALSAGRHRNLDRRQRHHDRRPARLPRRPARQDHQL
jgi:hypothetical protein